MTGFNDIQSIHVVFKNRDGVATGLTIDGTTADSDLMANVTVDDDGLTAAVEISGVVPNGTGYSFWSAEDWQLTKVRRGGAPVAARRPAKELGPLGKGILTVVSLAILAPFIWLLWDWAIGIVQR